MLAACGHSGPLASGQPVEASAAIPLSELLGADAPAPTEPVTVSGTISEVCRTSGCWFVLQEVKDGKLYELFTDLSTDAALSVPEAVRGRRTIGSGK